MLLRLLTAAAALLSGAEAAVPRVHPRLAFRANGTPIAPTTTSTALFISSTTTPGTSTSITSVTSETSSTAPGTSTSIHSLTSETTSTAVLISSTTTPGTSTSIASITSETSSTAPGTSTFITSETTFTTPGTSTSIYSITSKSTSTELLISTTTSQSESLSGSTTDSKETSTSTAPSEPTSLIDIPPLTFGSNGGITISGVVTIPSAALPTDFQATGTGGFVFIDASATSASAAFTDLAAAASVIAANPSPSPDQIIAFQEQAQGNFQQLSNLDNQIKDIDKSSLDDSDSHKLEEGIIGLGALLAFLSTQLSSLAAVVETPALAEGVLDTIATAFGAAVAGDLLKNAFEDLLDLGEDDSDSEHTESDSHSKTKASSETNSRTSTEASTETSTETSCTTETALQVTVICKPTTITDPSLITTTTCFSSTTITATGCDVTQETTTITETASASSQTPCAPGTCDGSCPIRRDGDALSDGEMNIIATDDCANIPTITTSKLPIATDGSLASKRDSLPNPLVEKLADQPIAKRALPDVQDPNAYVSSLQAAWVSQVGGASGAWYPFPASGHAAAGVNGIYGCTAVIIVSDRGVYLSHIWENPVFIDAQWQNTDDNTFGANSWSALIEGTPYARSIRGLVGTDSEPGDLSSFYEPKIYIVTPRSTDWDRQVAGITTELRYQGRVTTLANELQDAIPGSTWQILGYTRTSKDVSTGVGYLGRAILEVDPYQTWYQSFANPQDFNAMGLWRLWVENQMVSSNSFFHWGSIFTNAQKRDDSGVCTPNLGTTTTMETSTTDTATTTTTEQTESDSTLTTLSTVISSSQSSADQTSTTSLLTITEPTTTTTTTTTSGGDEITVLVPTSTQDGDPNAQTITTNDMVCVLHQGSNDPVCTPLSTPIPNPDGTNVHVTSGCILINGSPQCASDAGSISSVYQSSYNVASSPDEPYNTILILSGFDSSNNNHLHSSATCQLQARWPADLGDVIYGSDGCLYDTENNKIFDQCCTPPDYQNTGPATNPYCVPPLPDSPQSSGNNDGSTLCLRISPFSCLSAAERYVDDVVYRSYTSTWWYEAYPIDAGCTVIFNCEDESALAQGMTGAQIKQMFLRIYTLDNASSCGSSYAENSCYVTANGCSFCQDIGPSDALWSRDSVGDGTYGDANDGFSNQFPTPALPSIPPDSTIDPGGKGAGNGDGKGISKRK